MKKTEPSISTQLGLTQLELAMLLGVNRSQVAMYEMGQRDLPSQAMLRVLEMLTHINASDESSKKTPTEPSDSEQREWKKLYDENEYQLHTLTRKMEALTQKQKVKQNLVHLSTFFNQHKQAKNSLTEMIQGKGGQAKESLETNGANALLKLRIKHELLLHEKQLLESKLKQLAK